MRAERSLSGRDPATGRPMTVTVRDGLIAAVEDGPSGEDHWISAGLVDLQVNGFGGHDLNAHGLTVETVIGLARSLQRQGVTTFLPTLITAEHEKISHALTAIAEARRTDPLAAHAIPYVHLEGPHISPQEGPRGVHDEHHIRPPSLAEFDAWQNACGGLVGMVTLSPHYPGSTTYIAELASRGVHVAIGHTHADPEQIHAAARAGARLSTHLGNGAHAVLPRHPNYLWSQLADDDLTACFIADGHHLPPDTLTVMIRAKGLDRSILVSDAVAVAGLPPGRYRTPVGGSVELHDDGRLVAAGTPYLAGAARSLADGVAHTVRATGLSLAQAVRLATVQPGRFAGGRGRLEVGQPADLIRFTHAPGDRELGIDTVWIAGQDTPG
ncbi:amidohydrolase family protein [Sphaerisporangium sp. NPDC051011]|uniref:N-acetylglucosamine-6-phosphate deacetylase n=1 Tax=Sphaerisporangium sp. NPDC051011 TaxID=3155792 RepID=UPI0033EC84A5